MTQALATTIVVQGIGMLATSYLVVGLLVRLLRETIEVTLLRAVESREVEG